MFNDCARLGVSLVTLFAFGLGISSARAQVTILPTQGVGWGALGAALDPASDIMVVGAGVSDWGEFIATSVTSSGSINTAFGGGLVALSVAKPAAAANWAYAAAVQADGKLLSGGQYQYKNGIGFAVVRYNTNGTLDTTFSGNGYATTDFSFNTAIKAIALQGTNIVAAGGYIVNGSPLVLARYTTKGKLDTTFGSAGTTILALPEPGSRVTAVALQANGSIVVGADLFANGGVASIAVIRFTANGALDTSFGTNGFATFGVAGQSSHLSGIAVDGNNNIVVAGDSNGELAVGRLTPNGALDTTFGGIGYVTETFGSTACAVALQANGAIVVCGDAPNRNLLVARFLPNGALDPTFGSSGGVFNGQGYAADFPYSAEGISHSVLLPSNGQIVAIGAGTSGGEVNAVIRYNSNGTPAPPPPGSAAQQATKVTKKKATHPQRSPDFARLWLRPLAPLASAPMSTGPSISSRAPVRILIHR